MDTRPKEKIRTRFSLWAAYQLSAHLGLEKYYDRQS